MDVIVDERERDSGVPELLSAMGLEIQYAMLDIGDYVVTAEIGVERKTVRDFLLSIYDGRLFTQAKSLSAYYAKPLLILEGDLGQLESLSENIRPFLGALVSLATSYRLPVIPSSSKEQTAEYIRLLVDQSRMPREAKPLLPRIKKGGSIKELQLGLVGVLPGVGPKLAERLLETFGTPLGVFNAGKLALSRVRGLGWKKAVKIEEVLNTPYRSAPKYGTFQ